MIQPLGCVKSAATPAEIEVCPRKDACLSFCGRGRFLSLKTVLFLPRPSTHFPGC